MSFNGKKIKKPSDLPKLVRKAKIGQKVNLQIIRAGKTLNLKAVPELFEGNKQAAAPKKDRKQKEGIKYCWSFSNNRPQ